jgi:transposase
VLEDAENELPDLYRPTLNLLYGRLITIKEDMNVLNKQIASLVK